MVPWWVMVAGCSWLGVGVGTLACGVCHARVLVLALALALVRSIGVVGV